MSGALGNKEIMAKNLSYYMNKNNVSRNKLSDDLNISYTTIRDWVKAKTYPRIDKIELLANYFGIEKSDLVEERTNHNIVPIYNQLNDKNKVATYEFASDRLEKQLEEQKQSNNVIHAEFGNTDTEEEETNEDVDILGVVAAGYGSENFEKGQPVETVSLPSRDIPYHYDLAFKVSGDSMYPTFEDGEIIFVKQTTEVVNGMIGCVEIDKEAFIKKMYVEDGRLRLVSLNNDYNENGNRIYPDFYADENGEIYVIGRVII